MWRNLRELSKQPTTYRHITKKFTESSDGRHVDNGVKSAKESAQSEDSRRQISGWSTCNTSLNIDQV